MSGVLAALRARAQRSPEQAALEGAGTRLGYGALNAAIETAAGNLDGRCTALALDNGPAWAVLDLALLDRGITCVPLPGFFSGQQLAHALRDAAVDTVLTDAPERFAALAGVRADGELRVADRRVARLRVARSAGRAGAAPGIAKITYTSGTTGEPKGVCLRAGHMEAVAGSLCRAIGAGPADASLSLLPLATLLENIGGLYAPLLAGARAILQPLESLGIRGASGVDVPRFLAALGGLRPSTVILVPQLLQVLVCAAEAGWKPPARLRFAAVGGAPVSPRVLARAEQAGLPVHEGYGLSEAASVVCLNRPGERRTGSVGRALPHARVRIAYDGEVLVAGPVFAGYLGEADGREREWLHTGDLGYLDRDGYLHLTGRRRNVFITAYGRNVAPEWVERELLAEGAIAQAVLFGEARPINVAVLVPASRDAAAAVPGIVERVNARLPDYARVGRYVLAEAPFTVANGQLTGTGRPRREAIARDYAAYIENCYGEACA